MGSAVAAVLLAFGVSGCQTPVSTIIDPPGWNAAASTASPEPAGPTLEELRSAATPSLCGLPAGELQAGEVVVAESAAPIGQREDEVATGARLSLDDDGQPLATLAASSGAAIGAAAILECDLAEGTLADRVVVWDGALQPIGAIDLAALRGGEPVTGTAIELDATSVRVRFQELDADGSLDPAAVFTVPLTVERGRVVVGDALTVG